MSTIGSAGQQCCQSAVPSSKSKPTTAKRNLHRYQFLSQRVSGVRHRQLATTCLDEHNPHLAAVFLLALDQAQARSKRPPYPKRMPVDEQKNAEQKAQATAKNEPRPSVSTGVRRERSAAPLMSKPVIETDATQLPSRRVQLTCTGRAMRSNQAKTQSPTPVLPTPHREGTRFQRTGDTTLYR